MIKIDISKALPSGSFNYLAGFIPGLFFQISILLANPNLVGDLLRKVQSAYQFSYYAPLLLALALAFILGNGFMLFVRVSQRLLGRVYQLRRFLWKQMNQYLLLPSIDRLMKRPSYTKRPGGMPPQWLIRSHRYLHMQTLFSPALGEVQRVYHLIATRLLNQYGIVRSRYSSGADWGIWYAALGTPRPEDIRGSILVIAFHATGWCGITATHFAPALKNAYYVGFSSLLILCGLGHDWSIAKRFNQPVSQGVIAIRSLLRELRDAPLPKGKKSHRPEEDGGALTISDEE